MSYLANIARCVKRYEPVKPTEAAREAQLVNQIREAIALNSLELLYQPVVAVAESLPRDRVDDVRRVADQGETVGDELARDLEAQRKRLQRFLDRDEPQARPHSRFDRERSVLW